MTVSVTKEHEISPNPSLPKRGNFPPLEKGGMEGGFDEDSF